MNALPNPVIKRCPKCGEEMQLRSEDVNIGHGTITQYTYWDCPHCGHEEEKGKTYLQRYGEV